MPEYTTIISVSNIAERDITINTVCKRLLADPIAPITISRIGNNKIKVYHKTKDTIVPIGTYIVVIIPIAIDYESVLNQPGDTYYFLDNTINDLLNIVKKLQSLNRRKLTKGDNDAGTRETIRQLDRILCKVDGKY